MKKVIFLFFLFSLNIYSQEVLQKIPANVVEVKSFGNWQKGNEDGNYRLVVIFEGYEHVKNFAFIELIKSDFEEVKVIESFEIKEINEPAAFVISKSNWFRKENKDYIKFNLLNTYSLEESELLIQLNTSNYKVLLKK